MREYSQQPMRAVCPLYRHCWCATVCVGYSLWADYQTLDGRTQHASCFTCPLNLQASIDDATRRKSLIPYVEPRAASERVRLSLGLRHQALRIQPAPRESVTRTAAGVGP
jgi:hypothetical protein